MLRRSPLVAASGFFSFCLGDFHALTASLGVGSARSDQQLACPSNYWNCYCMFYNDRTGYIDAGNADSSTGGNFFSISAGLCGLGKMNFYLEGDHWNYYLDRGDGSKIGSCYSNSASKGCIEPALGYGTGNDLLICYGYPCNPWNVKEAVIEE